MKNIIFIVLFLLVTNVMGQTTRFNIQKDFHGNGDNATAVTEVKDGYLVLGNNIGPSSERFVTFCKIDSVGNEVWRKEYLKNGSNCYATKGINNYSDSTIIYISNYQFPSGKIAGGVMKATMQGDTLWHKTLYDTAFESQTHTIQRMPNGDYLISGSSNEFDFYVDIWLMRTDSLFNQIWIKHYPLGGTYEYTSRIDQMLTGEFLISSSTYNLSTQIVRPRLIITDSLGNFKRQVIYGNDTFSNSVPQAIQMDTNLIWSFALEGTFYTGSVTVGKVYLKFMDTLFNTLDTIFLYNSEDFLGGISGLIEKDSSIFAVSTAYNFSITKGSLYLEKFNFLGVRKLERMYNVYDLSDFSNDIIQTSDGGFMIVGTTQPYMMTQDWKMVKTDSLGCDTLGCEIYDNISELPKKQKYTHIEVYPNPATDIIYLKVDKETGFDFLGGAIELFDNMGKLVYSKHESSHFNERIQLNISDLSKGIYFGKVLIRGNTIGIFKVIKQ